MTHRHFRIALLALCAAQMPAVTAQAGWVHFVGDCRTMTDGTLSNEADGAVYTRERAE